MARFRLPRSLAALILSLSAVASVTLVITQGAQTTPPQQTPASQTPPTQQTPPPQPTPATPPPAGTPQQQPPRLRSGVDLVSLNVTVMEGSKYVNDLNEADFEVYEDGARQTLTFFSKVQQPIALAILLDTSASMNERLATAQEAAIGFARRMRTDDIMEVVDFDSQVRILQDFTNNKELLEKAIRGTDVNGSTSLYNAIYISLKHLKKIKASSAEEIRRQAIVVLSDGDDTSSIVPYEEVLDLAKRSETAIYAVGLRPVGVYRSEFKEAEFTLKQLSQETGGRAYFVTTPSELPKIYEQISEELANQYSLAYSSKNPLRNGAWRRIVVRVNKPNVTARTRQGYYGPESSR
jgi:Ca-activated chloride channel family protein